ncbi:hypothetical protein MUK42_37700 [Musa troglodytarum]|uniref:Uncharacterized protein n=1 Tax=Musa troglodytarum TaxID=320322 RepID=A0A9E7EWY5_9LILI|nr:hypothetical protein MUK42_37700 [Musa troglodytarum]
MRPDGKGQYTSTVLVKKQQRKFSSALEKTLHLKFLRPVHKANSQPFGLFVQSPNDCDAALSIAVSVAITAVVLRAVLSRIKLSISSINCLGKGVKVGIDGNCDIVIVSATSSLLPPLQPPLFYYSRSMTHLSKIPRIPLRKLRTVVSALYHSRTTSAIASPPLCLIGPIVTFMALAGLA